MELLAWIIMGALAGWIASIIMKTDAQQGWMMNIVLGIVGGLVGGFIMNLFGAPGAGGFNFYSLFVATAGAIVLIWLGKMFMRT
jgi:uncharacterized membrane protein YeaQ/YmgE (transglycosylase-associated protein family)